MRYAAGGELVRLEQHPGNTVTETLPDGRVRKLGIEGNNYVWRTGNEYAFGWDGVVEVHDENGDLIRLEKHERILNQGDLPQKLSAVMDIGDTMNAGSFRIADSYSANGTPNFRSLNFNSMNWYDLEVFSDFTSHYESAYGPGALEAFEMPDTFQMNLTGHLNVSDMNRLHDFGNKLRIAGISDVFEKNPQITKIMEILDFASATGLPFDAIKNLDASLPFDPENPDAPIPYDIEKIELNAWLGRLDSQDWSATFSHISDVEDRAEKIAHAQKSITTMQNYLQKGPPSTSMSGVKAMAWFMGDLMAGSTSDVVDLSKTFLKFSKNLANGFPNLGVKLLGKPVKELTEEGLGKLAKSIALKGGGKLLGPIATLAFLGMDMAEGIKSFKAWKNDPTKSDADLAYAVFLTMGGGPGGGFAALISARQKGASPKEVAKAFFAGLFGMYDPENPEGGGIKAFINNIKRGIADTQARRDHRDALRRIMANGFNGEQAWAQHSDEAQFYKDNYSASYEDAFYAWMDRQNANHPNYYARIPNVNGYYEGETWVWEAGQMPLWGVKFGAQLPIDSLDKLEVVGFTDHPTWSAPPVSDSEIGLGCWVAREVYGEQDRTWLAFREWLVNDAPQWFRALYFKHGQAFAGFIHRKPLLKLAIKSWMDTKIPEDVDFHSEKFNRLMLQYTEGQVRNT